MATTSNLPPNAAAQQQTPVIRTTTRLVEVTVVMQDKSGNPLTGLTKDDFVLKDEGKRQTISTFSVDEAPVAAAPRVLPPNTFVNRPVQRAGAMNGATVVLIDVLNSRLTDQQRVRENILRFLKQMTPQDPVALYSLDSKLRLLQEFTTEPNALIAALENYKAGGSAHPAEFEPQPPNEVASALEEGIRNFNSMNRHIADFQLEDRVERTTEAMVDIAHHLAGVRGRKNLIWVSGSFPSVLGLESALGQDQPGTFSRDVPSDIRDFTPQVSRATRALADANIAVYPVSSAGALGVWDIAPDTNKASVKIKATVDAHNPLEGLHAGSDLGPFESLHGGGSETTMINIALATGGRSFNKYELAETVRRALDDAHASYTLSYYPNHGKWDGKFHRIIVEVKRPGARLLHRPGYFATSTLALDKPQREQLLYDIASSPLDATGLSMAARPAISEAQAGKSLQLELIFNPREITFNAAGDQATGALDLLLVEEAANGKLLVSKKGTLDLNIKTEPGKEQKLFGYKQTLELMPSADHVRVIAVDTQSGAAGSLTIPVSKVVGTP